MRGFLSIFLIIICSLSAFCQQTDEVEIDAQQPKEIKNLYIKPVYRGFSLHADIASPIMGILNDKSVRTMEIQADVNLFDKIFPIVEIGYGKINAILDEKQGYRTSAPFFRVGFNYNLMKNATKDGTPKVITSYPFIGLRYGFEYLNYDIENVKISSPYWQEEKIINISDKGYAGWAELAGGVRVVLFEGFTMGWSVRLKTMFHSKMKNQMWYVLGHGFTNGSQFTFNYTIGYTFKQNKK